MSPFEHELGQRLSRAAEADPSTFDHTDVRARSASRHRRRSVIVGTLAIAIVAGVVGIFARTGGVDEPRVSADSPVPLDEITGDRWVVRAIGEGLTMSGPPGFVDFGRDGSLLTVGACGFVSGEWSIDGDRLTVSDRETQGGTECTATSTTDYTTIFDEPITVSTGGGPGSLRLEASGRWFSLERFDRLGVAPDEPDLTGLWTDLAGQSSVEFNEAGTATLRADPPEGEGVCERIVTWRIEDGRLLVDDELSTGGIPCDGVGGGAPAVFGSTTIFLDEDPRVRVTDDGTLWLSVERLGVSILVRA